MQKFKYFVGKELGIETYIEFYFFYSLVSTPIALHISVLISSLIAFGSLGQHSELIAIKSIGVSLFRIMRFPFLIALLLSGFGVFFNEKIHPYASLKAFSILYDVRQKKPTLEFEENVFYNGIPKYSIKIEKKYSDEQSIRDILIYDHSANRGNVRVIIADSAYMQFTKDEQYMRLDLFDGAIYIDVDNEKSINERGFSTNKFKEAHLYFTLASFQLQNTDDRLFMGHNFMKSSKTLSKEMDSVAQELFQEKEKLKQNTHEITLYASATKNQVISPDIIRRPIIIDSLILYKNDILNINHIFHKVPDSYLLNISSTLLRQSRDRVNQSESRFTKMKRDIVFDQIYIYRKYADAIVIFIMFLIGAPLGAIIKRGGLGLPVLVTIICFTFYYAVVTAGGKLAQEQVISPEWGCWIANTLCLILACILMNEARKDSYLFDLDYYMILINKFFRKMNL